MLFGSGALASAAAASTGVTNSIAPSMPVKVRSTRRGT
jgi:hypothetical protein